MKASPQHLAACVLAAAAGCVAGCEQSTSGAVSERGAPAAEGAAPSPEQLADKTFDDIKFDIEPGDPFDRSLLTDAIRELDGRRMRIRGYILPTAQKRGIEQFVLVRDNQECCFGPGAALYDCILVTMQEGETAEFSVRPVAVEGEFTIDEFYGPDGAPLAIYRLAGESVR